MLGLEQWREVGDKQFIRLQMFGLTAERILVGGQIVHVERHHPVDTHRLDQGGDIARGDRVAGLGLAVLARISQVGDNRRNPPGRGIPQGTEKEQHPAQLVVHALGWIGIQRLNNVHVLRAHIHPWANLVLAIFELPLLVLAQCDAEFLRDLLAKRTAGIDGEQREGVSVFVHGEIDPFT